MAKNSPISTFGLRIIKALLAAVFIIISSRWLTASGRGDLSVALFWLQLILLVYEIIGGSHSANMAQKYGLKRIAWLASIFGILIGVVGGFVLSQVLPQNWIWVWILYFPMAWLTLHYNLYQTLQQVWVRNYIQLSIEVIKLLVALLVYYINKGISVSDVLIVYAVVQWLHFALSWLHLRKYLGPIEKIELKPPTDLVKFGLTNQIAAIVQFLNYRLGIYTLNHYVGTDESGIFSNAIVIADLIWIYTHSFGGIAHMRLLKPSNAAFAKRIVNKYTTLSLTGTIVSLLIINSIPTSVYTYILGADFGPIKQVIYAISLGILALSFSNIIAHYLHAKNQFSNIVKANSAGLIVQLLVQSYLLKSYGLQAAAWSFSIGLSINALLLFIFYNRQKMRLHISLSSEWKWIKRWAKKHRKFTQ